MKHLVSLVCLVCFSCMVSAAPASPASIEKLLLLTNSAETISAINRQVDGMLKNTITQAMQGKTASPELQKILDDFESKTSAIIKEQLSYDKLKPTYVQIYSETFSQDEIDQLIVFYQSPTGKMFVSKMPMVTQKSMVLMQQQMAPMMQKIQQAAGEMKSQIDALKQAPAK